MKAPSLILAAALSLASVPGLNAAQPADTELISEAKTLFTYLESVYRKKVLSGVSSLKNAEAIFEECGKNPAIVAFDLSGWNSPTWGDNYTPVVQATVDAAKAWSAKGGIVALQFHWKHPMKHNGTAWVEAHGKNPPSGPFDMAAAVKPDSRERKAFMEDLAKHADYLQQLADARVPVLWRPFHEIDGGWFWWTDATHPENTAEMWRVMFNYLVKERKLHNLIWVYSAGLRPATKDKDVASIDFRRRFYPGDNYVDIAGMDIYPNPYYGWGKPQDDTYKKGWDIIRLIAGKKMLALTECQAIPDPKLIAKSGPKWLYALPWWGPGKNHPAEWVRQTYSHEFVVTLEELPWSKQLAKER